MAQKRFTTNLLHACGCGSQTVAMHQSAMPESRVRSDFRFTRFHASTRPPLRLAGRLERQRLDVVDDLPNLLLGKRALGARRGRTAGRHRRAGDAGRHPPEQIDRPATAAIHAVAQIARDRVARRQHVRDQLLPLARLRAGRVKFRFGRRALFAVELGESLLQVSDRLDQSSVSSMNSLFALLQSSKSVC